MLYLNEFSCGYGSLTVVNQLSLHIPKGKIFSLIGPNGAGKTSTIMTIAGHVELKSGSIVFNENDISRTPIKNRVKMGIAIAPEGRRLFSDMSVEENLAIGCYSLPLKKVHDNKERILEIFPRLKERLKQQAGSLSGGEQQMLAIGRALMADPELLIIDELSLGLMPKIIDLCYEAILDLKKDSVTILLVEQNTTRALEVSDNVCILESGRAVWQGTADDAKKDPTLIDTYLGIG